MAEQVIIDRETVASAVQKGSVEFQPDYLHLAGEPMCLAIFGSDRGIVQFYVDLAVEDYALASDLVDNYQWTGAGLEICHFFPKYRLSEPEDGLEVEPESLPVTNDDVWDAHSRDESA